MALTRLGLNQAVNLASNVTGTLATGNGGTGATSFAPGKVGQVLQAITTSGVTIQSTSYVDIGLSQAITPSATSSKILIMATVQGSPVIATNAQVIARYNINKDGSTHYEWNRAIGQSVGVDNTGGAGVYQIAPLTYLSSPNTTSAVTYKIQAKLVNSTSNSRTIYAQDGSTASMLTLMEILA